MSNRPNSSEAFFATESAGYTNGRRVCVMATNRNLGSGNWTYWRVTACQERAYLRGGRLKNKLAKHAIYVEAENACFMDAVSAMRQAALAAGFDRVCLDSCIQSLFRQRREPSGKAIAKREEKP